MRLAALAFGVLAGLVASLILALGGLDATALAQFDPRQLSLLRFGLFVVANFGILGAGVVLAAPLAGGILLVVGAIAWVAAALVLHHGPDYVLITPPVLLLVGAGFALVAVLRPSRNRRRDDYYDDAGLPPIRAAMADQRIPQDEDEDQDEDDEEPAGTQVRAGFFGQGGTASPARVEARPALHSSLEEPEDFIEARSDDWRPGRRKPPPRQQPIFRQPDDEYDDEESGFSRFARGFSSVASFGLYAALAGAAVLIFLNLRNADHGPAAARIEAKSSVAEASTAPPVAPVLASSSAPPPQVTAAAESPSLPATNLITAAPALDDAPMVAPAPATVVDNAASAETPPPDGASSAPVPVASPAAPPPSSTSEAPAAAEPAASEPPVTPTVATADAPMPFPVLPQMAAERARPAPAARTTAPPTTPRPAAPAAPRGDAGL